MRTRLLIFLLVLATGCSNKVSSPKPPEVKWDEQSIKEYLDKSNDDLDPIEGIYSINKLSCI